MATTVGIVDLRAATDYILNHMPQGTQVAGAFNGDKGPIAHWIKSPLGSGIRIWAATLKRGWLMTYAKQFPDQKGIGQTMKLALVEAASKKNAHFLIVMEDAKVYQANALAWLEYAKKNGTIRTPSTETGLEASVPAKFVSRWRPYEFGIGKNYPLLGKPPLFNKNTCNGCLWQDTGYCWEQCSENIWRHLDS
jgi:hypothetical protein